jgi:hypothetical protein
MQAFLSKALSAHPDKGGSAQSFALIQAAAQVLLDPDQRREHDKALARCQGPAKTVPKHEAPQGQPDAARQPDRPPEALEVRPAVQGACAAACSCQPCQALLPCVRNSMMMRCGPLQHRQGASAHPCCLRPHSAVLSKVTLPPTHQPLRKSLLLVSRPCCELAWWPCFDLSSNLPSSGAWPAF